MGMGEALGAMGTFLPGFVETFVEVSENVLTSRVKENSLF
jgi:hypothetical protein